MTKTWQQNDERSARRNFIKGTAALTASLGVAAQATERPLSADDSGALTASTLGEADKLFVLSTSETEKAQILETIEDQIGQIKAMRGLSYENSLAPSMVFDPRLPGEIYPEQESGLTLSPLVRDKMPAAAEDIAFASIKEQGAWIRSGQISSVELTNIYLARIKKYNGTLECFVTVTDDLALSQATAADKALAAGDDKGLLHGIPYGVKDLFDTAGIKTTWGAMPYKDRVASGDAAIVKMLQEAGAVLLGKTTCGAVAMGDEWFAGTTRNPWHIKEGSSGSSAGSASATSAALVGFSIGTETLGSIVSPSNRCGTTGLRPTFGRVSRTGGMALCWSLDKTGPICRSTEDTAIVLDAINGFDVTDAGSIEQGFNFDHGQDLSKITVGYNPAWFEESSDAEKNALKAMKSLGVKMKEVTIPDLPYDSLILSLMAESAAAFEELTLSGRDDLMKMQDKDAWPNGWRVARYISAVDYVQLDRLRRKVMQNMHQLFTEVDVLISPNYANSLLTITNYTGHPCLTLRAGYEQRKLRGDKGDAKHRLPINFSLMGSLFNDGTLCTLGQKMEEALAVYQERPKAYKA